MNQRSDSTAPEKAAIQEMGLSWHKNRPQNDSEKLDEVEAFDINKSNRKEDTTDNGSDNEMKGNLFRVNERSVNYKENVSQKSITD